MTSKTANDYTSAIVWRSALSYSVEPFDDSFADNIKVPDWCVGIEVNWNLNFDNCPTITVLYDKNDFDPSNWDDQVWEFDEVRQVYSTTHEDGRGKAHYAGSVSVQADGRWMTKQKDGYGGRHFNIKLKDGRDVILRGPFYGSSSGGFWEVTFGKTYIEGSYRPMRYFGLLLKSTVLMAIVKKYRPDLVFTIVINNSSMNKDKRQHIELMARDRLVPKVCWRYEELKLPEHERIK